MGKFKISAHQEWNEDGTLKSMNVGIDLQEQTSRAEMAKILRNFAYHIEEGTFLPFDMPQSDRCIKLVHDPVTGQWEEST